MSANCNGGIVVFNYTEWLAQYPEFAPNNGQGVTQTQAQNFFNRVTYGGLIDNTAVSPIQDLFQRTIILNLAVCHLAVLAGALNPSQRQLVGKINSATQGSVSVSTDSATKGGELAAYWGQTTYGATLYAMLLPFRTAFYVPPPVPAGPMIPYYGRYGRGRF